MIQKPWIKLKKNIEHEDYYLINKLKEECINKDGIVLKLELDYKLGINSENSKIASIHEINEFMYFDGEKMIGYIGICRFGGAGLPIEINGMVHPKYRRQGIFSILWKLVVEEYKRRNINSMLLLSDEKSHSGQEFIKRTRANYKHSEYEMYLRENKLEQLEKRLNRISLRKATNADAQEIARQNAKYFNEEFSNLENTPYNSESNSTSKEKNILFKDMILPEEEEKRGITTYLAEKDGKTIGKVNLQLNLKVGGIYGLGVLPKHRRKGFGREILIMAIQKLKEANANEIMLQVVAENSNALNLYKSCGFKETATMDYYEIRKEETL